MLVPDIRHRSLDFFTELPNETEKKLAHLYQRLSLGEPEDMSFELAQAVTLGVMRAKGNSDDLFLHWLHFIGHYIKVNYGGRWYLGQSQFPAPPVCYHPSIVNEEGRIWNVGDFCYTAYYVKGKLGGIGFPLFYKIQIEQVLGQSKAANWNSLGFRPLE